MQISNSAIFGRLLKKLETVKASETVSRHRPRAGGASPAVAGRWEVGGGREGGIFCGRIGRQLGPGVGVWEVEDGRTQPTPPRLRLKDSTTQTKVYLSGIRPDVMI